MKYVALLRGINVGGKNIIKMVDLKLAFDNNGLVNVSTFIQSGNVIFESDNKNIIDIETKIEKFLSQRFGYLATVVVLNINKLIEVVDKMPIEWQDTNNWRGYVAFVKRPLTPAEVAREIKINPAVDQLKIGENVIYMSTLKSGLTKSGFGKMIGTNIFKQITIRNFNSTKKILGLMKNNSLDSWGNGDTVISIGGLAI
jgi:uncharacterized protein (DUF1697 family)